MAGGRSVVRYPLARERRIISDTPPSVHSRAHHAYTDGLEVHIQLVGPLAAEQTF